MILVLSYHRQLRKKEDHRNLSEWLLQIDISSVLRCSFYWTPCLDNDGANALAKPGARHMVSFVEDFVPLCILVRFNFLD